MDGETADSLRVAVAAVTGTVASAKEAAGSELPDSVTVVPPTRSATEPATTWGPYDETSATSPAVAASPAQFETGRTCGKAVRSPEAGTNLTSRSRGPSKPQSVVPGSSRAR